jgi:hypothetical protein
MRTRRPRRPEWVEPAWAIVRDRDVRRRFPHVWRWARAALGLDDDPIEAHRPRTLTRRDPRG